MTLRKNTLTDCSFYGCLKYPECEGSRDAYGAETVPWTCGEYDNYDDDECGGLTIADTF